MDKKELIKQCMLIHIDTDTTDVDKLLLLVNAAEASGHEKGYAKGFSAAKHLYDTPESRGYAEYMKSRRDEEIAEWAADWDMSSTASILNH